MNWICPVCGDNQSRRFPVGTSFPLRNCARCAFVYLDQSVNKFKKNEEEYFGDGYSIRSNVFTELFLLNKARLRMRLIRKFRSTGNLLDIGCGTGELIHVATQLGYHSEGLEYSPAVAKYVREKYQAEVHSGDVVSAKLDRKYDVVVMNHVLEHTTDPVSALQNVAKMLNTDGVLQVAVPNIDCYESRFRGWTAYEPYHLWYFSPATLNSIMEKAGYKAIHIKTWEPYSAWLNTIIRSVLPQKHEELRSVKERSGGGMRRHLIIGLMGLLNVSRFVSGFMLTPLRKYQEKTQKGEELVGFYVYRGQQGA